MILKRVLADNILKYRRLRITEIPAQGQIAVAGDNEAGKTAIGETICFGLFGRTFSLEPDAIAKVIRWGEFQGSVLLEFTGRDGGSYVIVRRIDNNGKHTARMHISGEKEPLADGVAEVAEALTEVGGFTYKAFIDSFYLAQREMEVPHAKSATVKALIGVDRLESVTTELQAEMAELNQQVEGVQDEIRENQASIAAIKLDRARLGRLESERDAKVESAATAQAHAAELMARAEGIKKAATAFVGASEKFVASTLRSSQAQWRERRQSLAAGLAKVAEVSGASANAGDANPLKATAAAIDAFDQGLTQYDKVRDLAGLYQKRLTHLLDEAPFRPERTPDHADAETEERIPFIARRDATQQRIERLASRRKPLLGFGVFFVEVAALAWAAWAVLLALPESRLGEWLAASVAMGEAARQLLFLFGALSTSVLAVLIFVRYVRTTRDLRTRHLELENIEAATAAARDELDMIAALEDAAVPDALAALRCVRNELLSSAVVAFEDGAGAILVRPDALSDKLAEIRSSSAKATRSLLRSQERIARTGAEQQEEAEALQQSVVRIETDIRAERKRWEDVEAFERHGAGLLAAVDNLRRDVATRRLACELIEGTCRHIYARFHPELRRFVSRILPELTEDRYEHLELDDDLRVRVYCKEKNDFVGLAEISNGTHRQLMLCVRLALSQALIASSSKAAQFIFFDEPFAFFDLRRMVRAIDVLGRISPQITQVWLAAQKFDDPGRFDMVIPCDVRNGQLVVSGGRVKTQPTPTDAAPVDIAQS